MVTQPPHSDCRVGSFPGWAVCTGAPGDFPGRRHKCGSAEGGSWWQGPSAVGEWLPSARSCWAACHVLTMGVGSLQPQLVLGGATQTAALGTASAVPAGAPQRTVPGASATTTAATVRALWGQLGKQLPYPPASCWLRPSMCEGALGPQP